MIREGTRTSVVIEPPKKWATLNLKDMWEHRELFWMLAWRDLKVRYKQTELGIAWAILQPVFTIVVFSLVFGRLAGLDAATGGIPYPVFAFAALLPWSYFSTTLTRASNSLVDSAALVTKVYFPRLLLPLSSAVGGLADLGVAFAVLLAVSYFYGIPATVAILAVPLLVLLTSVAAMGIGLVLGAVNVKYRDVRFLTPFLTQSWMYLSPVVYPTSKVPAQWRVIYSLNPMVGVIDGFRWAILGNTSFPGLELGMSVAVVAPLAVLGLFYFRRMERMFADVV